MVALSLMIVFVGMVAAASIWSGFALSILWGWFMVPALGLPPLSLPAAIGIALIVNYMTHQYINTQPEHRGWPAFWQATSLMVIKPLMALGVGWVAKQWM